MNKPEIIQESVKIANQHGAAGVTIAALAKIFRGKPPSLYKHIRSLQEIHDELGILCLEKLIGIIQKESFGLAGDNAVRQFCISSRNYALANPGLYQAMQLTHVHRGERYQEKAKTLIKMLSTLIAQYNIRKKDQIHAIRNLRSLLHGFIDLELQHGFGLPANLEQSFRWAVENFIFSIKHFSSRSMS